MFYLHYLGIPFKNDERTEPSRDRQAQFQTDTAPTSVYLHFAGLLVGSVDYQVGGRYTYTIMVHTYTLRYLHGKYRL